VGLGKFVAGRFSVSRVILTEETAAQIGVERGLNVENDT